MLRGTEHCSVLPMRAKTHENRCILRHPQADKTHLFRCEKLWPAGLASVLDSDKITLVASETAALTASRSGNTESGLCELRRAKGEQNEPFFSFWRPVDRSRSAGKIRDSTEGKRSLAVLLVTCNYLAWRGDCTGRPKAYPTKLIFDNLVVEPLNSF
jgi:hypothetical protein